MGAFDDKNNHYTIRAMIIFIIMLYQDKAIKNLLLWNR